MRCAAVYCFVSKIMLCQDAVEWGYKEVVEACRRAGAPGIDGVVIALDSHPTPVPRARPRASWRSVDKRDRCSQWVADVVILPVRSVARIRSH